MEKPKKRNRVDNQPNKIPPLSGIFLFCTMENRKWKGIVFLGLIALTALVYSIQTSEENKELKFKNKLMQSKMNEMNLGAFSVSLSVKDLSVSRDFYQKLGFKVFAGSMDSKYLIMKNGNALIGLFQGMFNGNILTFNPGWDENAQNLKEFADIRTIQKHLKSEGLSLNSEADEAGEGPASLTLTDPDGNLILLDQHG